MGSFSEMISVCEKTIQSFCLTKIRTELTQDHLKIGNWCVQVLTNGSLILRRNTDVCCSVIEAGSQT